MEEENRMAGDPSDDLQRGSPEPYQAGGRDKRNAVAKGDSRGSSHISDDRLEPRSEAETPLIADASSDVAPALEEFMDQAAKQNEAAAEAVPENQNKPGPYISF